MTESTNDSAGTVPEPPTLPSPEKVIRRRLTRDPEVSALVEIGEVMNGLKDAEQARVLAWLNAKYGSAAGA